MKTLTHRESGLFCISPNSLQKPRTYVILLWRIVAFAQTLALVMLQATSKPGLLQYIRLHSSDCKHLSFDIPVESIKHYVLCENSKAPDVMQGNMSLQLTNSFSA